MNSSEAEFRMASLCVSYLNFDCFCLETPEQDFREYSSNGSYAFQQYAVCNWIQHVQSLKNCWELLDNSDCTLVYDACRALLQRDMPDHPFEIPPPSKLAKPAYSALHKALCSLNGAYRSVGSLSDNGIPLAMQHMCQVRKAVEHLFSISPNAQTSKSLLDSYGPLLFKCPIVQCPSFQQGFATQSARDNHYQVHEPPFKCPHKGCEYSILGFLAELTLKTHLRLCHDPISDQITFPKVNPRSVEDALNHAIDKDDITAINNFATELSLIVDRNTGFLLRAIQKGSQQAAVLISTLLGTKADLAHGDGNRRTAFFEAAQKGYAEVLNVLVSKHDILDTREMNGRTALFIAAFRGHKAVARLLIDKGVDASGTIDGWTALHRAARYGHEALVGLLLDQRVNANVKSFDGETPLHLAASNGNEAVVRLLLDEGAEVNLQNEKGEAALHQAAWKGHEAVVRLLIDKGAEVKAKANNGETALHKAINSGQEAIARLLLEGLDINAKDSSGRTRLHWAAFYGKEAVATLLLDEGAEAEVKDNSGETALHLAMAEGREAMATGKEAKAKVNDKSWDSKLYRSRSQGNEAMVRLLLNRDVSVTAEDNNGLTPLHTGAKYRNETWCGCCSTKAQTSGR